METPTAAQPERCDLSYRPAAPEVHYLTRLESVEDYESLLVPVNDLHFVKFTADLATRTVYFQNTSLYRYHLFFTQYFNTEEATHEEDRLPTDQELEGGAGRRYVTGILIYLPCASHSVASGRGILAFDTSLPSRIEASAVAAVHELLGSAVTLPPDKLIYACPDPVKCGRLRADLLLKGIRSVLQWELLGLQ